MLSGTIDLKLLWNWTIFKFFFFNDYNIDSPEKSPINRIKDRIDELIIVGEPFQFLF